MDTLGYSVTFFLEYALLVVKSLKDDVEALNLLSEYNYTSATIDEGMNAHTIAQEMETAQIAYHAEMINVSADFDKLYDFTREQFVDYSGIILLEFKNDMDAKLSTLAAEASAERNRVKWLKRAKEFYTYVLRTPKIMTRIAQYNFTNDRIEAAFNKVVEAENAKAQHINLKGKAQDAIIKRNEALGILVIWIRKLLKVSTAAFKSRPQFMEKCGIVVLSEGYKRVRNNKETPSDTSKTTAKVDMPPDME